MLNKKSHDSQRFLHHFFALFVLAQFDENRRAVGSPKRDKNEGQSLIEGVASMRTPDFMLRRIGAGMSIARPQQAGV